MAEIAALAVADPAPVWEGLGFTVDDNRVWVSGIALMLGAAGEGVTGWTLRDVAGLDELPAGAGAPPEPRITPFHLNGVVALDHIVVTTPDLARTIDAFVGAGIRLRRTRDAGSAGQPRRQAFFRLGGTIVEVVGSPASSGPGPAQFWGLAFTVADLDATAELLGDRLEPAITAVQPGRRIATLVRAAGSTVPMAFMSPDRR